jgi:hypothetical protein
MPRTFKCSPAKPNHNGPTKEINPVIHRLDAASSTRIKCGVTDGQGGQRNTYRVLEPIGPRSFGQAQCPLCDHLALYFICSKRDNRRQRMAPLLFEAAAHRAKLIGFASRTPTAARRYAESSRPCKSQNSGATTILSGPSWLLAGFARRTFCSRCLFLQILQKADQCLVKLDKMIAKFGDSLVDLASTQETQESSP